MIYERYSGLDTSGEIPQTLAKLDRDFDSVPVEERLKLLESLLARERDPNWRGYFKFSVALDLKALERTEDARETLSRAIREFDPLAGNIRDVMPQYTGAFYSMILDHLWVDDDAETIAEYGSILAANMGESMLNSFGVALSFGYLARAMSAVGYAHGLQLCHRLALAFALRAHHAEPDDPMFLETLLYCYFNVRDAQHCGQVYEMFLRVGPPDDMKQRVDRFMRERFHEIGGNLGLPT